MSGGSWDYAYLRLDEVAERLITSDPKEHLLRVRLGAQLKLMVAALHDIEWVDSGDLGEGDDEPAIKAALGALQFR
jgi:hypothetical protein